MSEREAPIRVALDAHVVGFFDLTVTGGEELLEVPSSGSTVVVGEDCPEGVQRAKVFAVTLKVQEPRVAHDRRVLVSGR